MSFTYTWRWFGPEDPIKLEEIKQSGATGIVSALHHIPNGEIWPVEEIEKRKEVIEDSGFSWEVIESLPVHENIKLRKGDYPTLIENYKQSLKHIGKFGIKTACYNFMPVLDWTRTDLNLRFPDGSIGLAYKHVALAAFDLFILRRPDAETDYQPEVISEAENYYRSLTPRGKTTLTQTILKGLPGSEESYSLKDFQTALDQYKGIGIDELRENFLDFLKEIILVAEENRIRMAIHPDDPPWSLFGLPKVVSTLEDAQLITAAIDSPSNGITLCSGSFGAGYFNDVACIAKEMAPRINFAHLRNVKRNDQLNFHEDYLLQGDVDIQEVVKILVREEQRRKHERRSDWQIPVRPDHGNRLPEEMERSFNPGYSLYGRMKGLKEIRGLEMELRRNLKSIS